MVKMYRCKGCGYLHVGPAPEVCPVCGAPQSLFAEYERPRDMTGSKTLENLKAAFAGESQANRRYKLWSRIAELEGAREAVTAFDAASAEETAHALGHLAYIAGATSTADNLSAAVEGEGYEFREMYPEFAEAADAEGFTDIAHYFRQVGSFEAKHRTAYQKALDNL